MKNFQNKSTAVQIKACKIQSYKMYLVRYLLALKGKQVKTVLTHLCF